jgi:hypothetical protein
LGCNGRDRRSRTAAEEVKRAAADVHQAKLDIAVNVLVAALPIPKNPDAIELLKSKGLSRDEARQLITDRTGRDWIQIGSGNKTNSYILNRSAGINGAQTPSRPTISAKPIPAALRPQGPQESLINNGSLSQWCQTP